MNKQYRVVVPFAGHEAGDVLDVLGRESGGIVLAVRRTKGGVFNWIDLEFIADKVEEVKPKTLRRWLVEEVATEDEAIGTSGMPTILYGCWVKITEQNEVPAQAERWIPAIGEWYYTDCEHEVCAMPWTDDDADRKWLNKGRVFKTRKECQAYIDRKKVSETE